MRRLCETTKKIKNRIFLLSLVAICFLIINSNSGEMFVVSAAEAVSAENEEDIKVFSVKGDKLNKGEAYTSEGTEGMLFAGWFLDEECTSPVRNNTTINASSTYYAKYVDARVLSIKLQLRQNADDKTATDMRVVSSVDSLNYASVGFDVYFYNGETETYVPFKSGTVQRRIKVNSKGVAYDFSPKVIDSASEYFVSATIKKIAESKRDCDFYIKPYWVTLTGVKVHGQSRYVSATDGLNVSNINIPVEMAEPAEAFTVTLGEQEVNAELAHYETDTGCAHLNISVAGSTTDRTQLPSATKIQISDDVQMIYRNYSNESTDADTSWYTVDSDANEFVIANKADLKGFASIVNEQTDLFAGDKVILVSDVAVNKGTVNDDITDWEQWTPIGSIEDNRRFSGVFEGDDNSISGIYVTNTVTGSTTGLGLFGGTETGSTIQNLRLEESYFIVDNSSHYKVGSIVADCHGNLDNVYSNATIHSSAMASETDMRTGGLVGSLDAWDYQNSSAGTIAVTNCWYEGRMSLGINTRFAGGLVGDLTRGTINMTNCLFTGNILDGNTVHATDYVGGFFGDITESQYETVVNISSCISAGEVLETINNYDIGGGVGAIGGYLSFSSWNEKPNTYHSVTLTLDNVFASRECHAKSVSVGSSTHELQDEDGNSILDESGNVITAKTVLEGRPVWTYSDDRLIGYCTELTGESLDYTRDWSLRTAGVPIPKTMEDVVGISNVVEDEASLEVETGLDTLDKKVDEATNMGMGNYVHTIVEKSYDDYQGYLTTLRNLGYKAYVSLEDGTTEDDGTAVDNVYNAVYVKQEGGWVVNTTYVENLQTLYITIGTGGLESLSPHLQYDEYGVDRKHDMAGKVTFTMSQLTQGDKGGNQFILRLPNGHFIVNDGGHREEAAILLDNLKSIVQQEGETKVFIDAWIISHQHSDHAGIFYGINDAVKTVGTNDAENPLKDIYVEGLYLNEPNDQTLSIEDIRTSVINQYRGMSWLTNSNGERTPIYRFHTGQRYYFSGVCMDVIQTQEVLPIVDKAVWASEGLQNAISTTLVYTMNSGEKVFWSGDATHLNTDYIMKAYGSATEGDALSELLYEPITLGPITLKEGTLSVDSLEAVVTGTNTGVTKTSEVLSGISVYIAPHHGMNTTLPFANWLATANGEKVDGSYKFDTILFPYYRFQMTGLESLAVETNYVAAQQEAQDYANQWLIANLIEGGSVTIDEENDTITVTGEVYHYGDGSITLSFEKTDTSGGEGDVEEPEWSLPF